MAIGTDLVQITNSSNLTGASYNPKSKDLFVHFKGGTVYRYAKVPKAKWTAFKKVIADKKKSAGTWLASDIKPKYAATKVEADPEE